MLVEVDIYDVLDECSERDIINHFGVKGLRAALARYERRYPTPEDFTLRLLDEVEAEVRLRAANQPDRLDSALRDLRAALSGEGVTNG